MDNKYVNRSKISEAKFRELVKLFALDLTATQMAELSGLNRNTINRYLTGIRRRLAEYCAARLPFTHRPGAEEMDNIERKCVGISEKEDRICTILLDKKAVINGSSQPDTSMLSEIDLLIEVESNERLWKSEPKVQADRAKIKRIDGFWGYVTTRLEKFKGIHSQTYFLHLKESEFRYNNDKDKLYHLILKIIRNHPLF